MRFFIFKQFSIFLLLTLVCSKLNVAYGSQRLTFIGSTSVAELINETKKDFKEKTGITISIRAVGSDTGIQASAGNDNRYGVPDLGMASRPMSADEKAKYPFLKQVIIANDGVVIVVSNNNPINNITKEQVASAYLSTKPMWSELYPDVEFKLTAGNQIQLISKETNHATFGIFADFFAINKTVSRKGGFIHFSGKNSSEYLSAPIEMVNNDKQILMRVKIADNSIGYISLASQSMLANHNAKALALDGVMPSTENIQMGRYELTRPLTLIVNTKKSSAVVDKYLEFLKGDSFKKQVEKLGLVVFD